MVRRKRALHHTQPVLEQPHRLDLRSQDGFIRRSESGHRKQAKQNCCEFHSAQVRTEAERRWSPNTLLRQETNPERAVRLWVVKGLSAAGSPSVRGRTASMEAPRCDVRKTRLLLSVVLRVFLRRLFLLCLRRFVARARTVRPSGRMSTKRLRSTTYYSRYLSTEGREPLRSVSADACPSPILTHCRFTGVQRSSASGNFHRS